MEKRTVPYELAHDPCNGPRRGRSRGVGVEENVVEADDDDEELIRQFAWGGREGFQVGGRLVERGGHRDVRSQTGVALNEGVV